MTDKLRAALLVDYFRQILPALLVNREKVEIDGDIEWHNNSEQYRLKAERFTLRNSVLLWEKPPIFCTCHTLDNGHVEVCLASRNVEIHREVFSDTEAAARFALVKMRAYNAF